MLLRGEGKKKEGGETDAVRGPLAAGDGEETTGRHVDEVVPDEALRVLGVGVLDEGPQAAPRTEDVAPPDADVRAEVVPHLVEDPLDLLLLGDRVLLDLGRRVGRAGDRVALPGEEEDDAPVRRRGVDEANLCRRVVVGQRDVDARCRRDNVLRLLVVHRPDPVREGARRVDDALRECAPERSSGRARHRRQTPNTESGAPWTWSPTRGP